MNKQAIVFLAWMIGLALGIVGSSSYAKPLAPDFQFTTDQGQVITKKSLEGKPTVLMFWASWCGVCQRELPKMKVLYDEKKRTGLQVLAIGTQDKESNIQHYVKGHPEVFTFPVAYDRNNNGSTAFGIRGVPTFVLLNEKGEVALTHVGGGFLNNPAFKKFIQGI